MEPRFKFLGCFKFYFETVQEHDPVASSSVPREEHSSLFNLAQLDIMEVEKMILINTEKRKYILLALGRGITSLTALMRIKS